MIEAVAEVGQTIYEAYRPDEIISYIKENPEYENVTIALSGDTGFYSGAKKILELTDRKSTRLNSSHRHTSRMPSSA